MAPTFCLQGKGWDKQGVICNMFQVSSVYFSILVDQFSICPEMQILCELNENHAVKLPEAVLRNLTVSIAVNWILILAGERKEGTFLWS